MTRNPPHVPLVVAALALASCTTSDLTPGWKLDRMRILAVQAEPAEPSPGDTVSFSSLVYTPPGMELEGVLWIGCLLSDAGDFGCELDTEALDAFSSADFENMSTDELAELYEAAVAAGLIGFEPALPPSWTAPEEALEGLEGDALLEGRSALVNLTAFPADAQDDSDVEIAYKRVPVSLSETPNSNPVMSGLLINGLQVESGDTFVGKIGFEYELEPIFTEASVETYDYINSAGETEERVEEPYFTWYTEDGSFDQEFSLYPYSSVVWTPGAAESNKLMVVMRDRRGGMAWVEIDMVLDCLFVDVPYAPCEE